MSSRDRHDAPRKVVVAIDGPSGVGKSTIAREVADRLGVPMLDTGATYRAIGLRVLEAGVDPEDRDAVLRIAEKTELELRRKGNRVEVLADGEEVEAKIRTPEVSEVTSQVSTYPEIRRRLVALQREGGERFGAVVEGRDIGTVVFPGTPHKFFLEARPEVRVERRFRQLEEAGKAPTRREVEEQVARRDARDASRAESPLTHDDSYRLVDSSDATPEEVVVEIVDTVRTVEEAPIKPRKS